MTGLAVRSLMWTVLMPGVVAGYVPWRFFGLRLAGSDLRSPVTLAALAVIVVGAGLLASCIYEFARSGRGTLAPMDPPKDLVVEGLYRYVRNPMYLAVAMLLTGEVLLTRSRPLLVYAAIWFVAVNVFVLVYEEPVLLRQFGPAYSRYTAAVGRWIPRRPAPVRKQTVDVEERVS